MKILQISSAGSLGGGERHLVDLVRGLLGRGHEVHVALRPGSPLIGELGQIDASHRTNLAITTLALRNSLDASSARALSKLVRSHQIQIVHAHMGRDYPLASYAARGNEWARLIVTRHVLFPLNRLHRVTLSKAARIIAVSKAVGAQLQVDRVAATDRISVVLNGIDVKRFDDARRDFNRKRFNAEWGLAEDTLLIGTVGELTPLKGHEEFVKAAAEVRKQFPSARFIVAGTDSSNDNKNHTALENLIKELDLGEYVRLVGWVDDLPQLYCALDVFVSASHTESFGLVIAEAMASGTPVVATATEGAREIVQSGKTGVLVPVGDIAGLSAAITELLVDREQSVRLAANAQLAVKAQFSVERMVDETEEIYRTEITK